MNGASDAEQLGVASVFGAAALLPGVSRGTTALFRGLNVVYGRKDTRRLPKFTMTSLIRYCHDHRA